jgi:hypothetical protein
MLNPEDQYGCVIEDDFYMDTEYGISLINTKKGENQYFPFYIFLLANFLAMFFIPILYSV